MSNDNDTPDVDPDLEGGDVDDLATLEVDPDELPEGEEVDPDSVDDESELSIDADPTSSDATDEVTVGVVDDERLNMVDEEEAEKPRRKKAEDIVQMLLDSIAEPKVETFARGARR